MRGRDQRMRPLRRALQVGLRARQRRLPAAPRRRRARAGGSRHAVCQPGAGDRRLAARPHRPRRAARPPLRRAADGTDGVADAHPRELGHAADGHGRRRPALRRLLACGVASRTHPRRRRHLPARPGAARTRLGQSQRGWARQRRQRRVERRRGVGGLHVVRAAAVGLSVRLRGGPPDAVPRTRRRARRIVVCDGPGLVRVARRHAGVDVRHPPQRPASRRAPARASERLRRLQHLGAADVYGRSTPPGCSWAACSPTPTSEAAANTAAPGTRRRVKTRRQNAFDDYIAAARWLVSAGYTTPSKLVSRGNSNGGLLVAVTAMQAPEAFGAVLLPRAPPRHAALSVMAELRAGRPSNTARPTIPSRARISPATRRITTSEPIAAIP